MNRKRQTDLASGLNLDSVSFHKGDIINVLLKLHAVLLPFPHQQDVRFIIVLGNVFIRMLEQAHKNYLFLYFVP